MLYPLLVICAVHMIVSQRLPCGSGKDNFEDKNQSDRCYFLSGENGIRMIRHSLELGTGDDCIVMITRKFIRAAQMMSAPPAGASVQS